MPLSGIMCWTVIYSTQQKHSSPLLLWASFFLLYILGIMQCRILNPRIVWEQLSPPHAFGFVLFICFGASLQSSEYLEIVKVLTVLPFSCSSDLIINSI